MPTIRTNGVELYYEETGVGSESIVFVPGFAWGTRLFREQIAAFKDRYRCIAYEPRGQGRSENTPGGYELDNLAADAIGLIETLGAAPCHLVGHSIGGSIAFRIAARRPELVRSLILFNSAVDEDSLWIRVKYWLMSFAVQALGMRLAAKEMMKAQFSPTFRRDPTRAAERDEIWRLFRAQNKNALAHAVRGWIRSPPAEPELPKVAAPTLVVAGAEDPTVRNMSSKQVADCVQHGRFILLPGCGHSIPVEMPEKTNEILRDFLVTTESKPN
jgi:3-oxoadipate enol-lactonase